MLSSGHHLHSHARDAEGFKCRSTRHVFVAQNLATVPILRWPCARRAETRIVQTRAATASTSSQELCAQQCGHDEGQDEKDAESQAAMRALAAVSAEDRIQEAEHAKEVGNGFVKAGDVKEAFKNYTIAAELVDPILEACADDVDACYRERAAAVVLALRLNMAQACLNSGEWLNAMEYANIVLEMDADNHKALYRRAVAAMHLGTEAWLEQSCEDLRRVVKMKPTTEVKDQLKCVTKRLHEVHQQEKQQLALAMRGTVTSSGQQERCQGIEGQEAGAISDATGATAAGPVKKEPETLDHPVGVDIAPQVSKSGEASEQQQAPSPNSVLADRDAADSLEADGPCRVEQGSQQDVHVDEAPSVAVESDVEAYASRIACSSAEQPTNPPEDDAMREDAEGISEAVGEHCIHREVHQDDLMLRPAINVLTAPCPCSCQDAKVQPKMQQLREPCGGMCNAAADEELPRPEHGRNAASYVFRPLQVEDGSSPPSTVEAWIEAISALEALDEDAEDYAEDQLDLMELQYLLNSAPCSSARFEVREAGCRPILVTAPHSIYLLRDGHEAHYVEEKTADIGHRIAAELEGTSLSWTSNEQRRSRLLASLGKRRSSDAGVLLDPRNRDPNYLTTMEVETNPWFQEMMSLSMQWREHYGENSTSLHIDVHGCRNPPESPAHLTVGLGAMCLHAYENPEALAHVKAFSISLETELTTALAGLRLEPKARLVHVAILTGNIDCARFSGACLHDSERLTQSQQAISLAKFTHSVQLEMSKGLRTSLSKTRRKAIPRLAKALRTAWHRAQLFDLDGCAH